MGKTVYFIAGYGRSGSTLIANILSSSSRLDNFGEMALYFVNSEMHQRKIPCSCGESGQDCKLWGSVQDDVYSILYGLYDKIRLKKIMFSPPEFSDNELEVFRNAIKNIVGDREEFIDASKHPGLIHLYVESGFNVKIVHCFRGVHETVDSWTKEKSYLRKKSVIKAALDWRILNKKVLEIVRFRNLDSIKIGFYDFSCHPGREVNRVLSWMGQEPFYDQNHRRFDISESFHSIAGNPDKFNQTNVVEVKKEFGRKPKLYDWVVKLVTIGFKI